jgi:hypothetical protein
MAARRAPMAGKGRVASAVTRFCFATRSNRTVWSILIEWSEHMRRNLLDLLLCGVFAMAAMTLCESAITGDCGSTCQQTCGYTWVFAENTPTGVNFIVEQYNDCYGCNGTQGACCLHTEGYPYYTCDFSGQGQQFYFATSVTLLCTLQTPAPTSAEASNPQGGGQWRDFGSVGQCAAGL